jgi:hypothetical protein
MLKWMRETVKCSSFATSLGMLSNVTPLQCKDDMFLKPTTFHIIRNLFCSKTLLNFGSQRPLKFILLQPASQPFLSSQPLGHLARYPADTKPAGIVFQGGPAGSSHHHKPNATGVFLSDLHRDMSWQSCLGAVVTRLPKIVPKSHHRRGYLPPTYRAIHGLSISPTRVHTARGTCPVPLFSVPSPGYTSAQANVTYQPSIIPAGD